MKKHLFHIIMLLSVMLLAGACTDETENSAPDKHAACLTLQLRNHALVTRATEDGVNDYNENLISTVTCYFYPDNATTDKAVYVSPLIQLNQNSTATTTINIPEKELNELFPAGTTTCRVYAMANLPVASQPAASTTIAALKQTVVEANFAAPQQASFVMDGEAKVTLAADRVNLTGTVELTRAASKIALFANVDATVTDEAGNEWTSQPENIRIFFHQGVKKSYVDGTNTPYAVQADDYFDEPVDANGRMFTINIENSDYNHTHIPFYSYPSDWGKATSPDREAYLTLVVPWRKSGDTDYSSCYYQIPINEQAPADQTPGIKQLVRNCYYKIMLHVARLGSFVPETPVELNPSYIVLDWSKETLSVDMKQHRYLVVDQNKVELHNQDAVAIGYLTSHNVKIVNIKFSRPNLKNNIAGTTTFTLKNYCCPIKLDKV